MWRGLLSKDFNGADIAIFGMPFDSNCSIGKGASRAPKIMRQCSDSLPPLTAGGELIPSTLYDLGDISVYDYESVKANMSLCCGKKLTLALGGDHSVSILSQKAYREIKVGRLGIIHIDAHADICDSYLDSHYSHACVNRRALENGYAPEDITMIGIRSYELQETKFLKNSSVTVYSAEKVRESIDAVISSVVKKYSGYDGVYLSFDIDALDPAYAPGTGTPEAFGLTSLEVLKILTKLVTDLKIDVMDVVEVSPPLDCNNITSWLALKYIYEIINIIAKKRRA